MGEPVTSAMQKLTPAERAVIRKAMQYRAGPERRRDSRTSLEERQFQLLVRIGDTGGLVSVTPRDISSSGLGFYHICYIHPDTRVHMVMKGSGPEALAVDGTVVRCKHVRGRVHEVGVFFDERIEVGVIVKGASSDDEVKPLEPAEVYNRIEKMSEQLKSLATQKEEFGTILQHVGELAHLLIQISGDDEESPPPASAPKRKNS